MPELVVINGAPGIGKSTMAEIVFSRLANAPLLGCALELLQQ